MARRVEVKRLFVKRWDAFAVGLPEIGTRVRDGLGREGVVIEQSRHAYSWLLDASAGDPACGWRLAVLLDEGTVLVYRPCEVNIVE
mgnify:CR=1 FL=1